MDINSVVLIGRLTKDIELRYTQSNIACGQFDIAINNGKDNQGNDKKPDFIRVVVWDKQAENMAKYTKKGSKVAIDGSIKHDSYEDENGKKHYRTFVLAHRIQFLDSSNRSEEPLPQEPDYLNKSEGQKDPFAEMGQQVSAEFSDEDGYPWE